MELMIYAPSAVTDFVPVTLIGIPAERPCSSAVTTVISRVPLFVVIELMLGMVVSPLFEKNDGVLLISSTVSHLVGCTPYSKSVSIKFSG